MLLSVSGVPQELGALAAPVELAPALVGTAFPVPDEDGDDRFGQNAHQRVNLHSLVRLTHVLTRRQRIFGNHQCLCGEKYGGESGIRTHVTLSSKHAFQACAFSHSAISPAKTWEDDSLVQLSHRAESAEITPT